MKKYFLHNGTESSGPFDLEELKAKKITRATPVWHEGLDNWKTAGDIEALEILFMVLPPPIKTETIFPPKPILEQKKDAQTVLGLSKNTFFVVLSLTVLIIFTGFFNAFQEKRSQELEIKNHKTEIGNYQYEQQQKEIEEQKIQAAIQETIEADRLAAERKETINKRLIEIQSLLEVNSNNLEEAKKKLENANGFKILRTASERNQQITSLQNDIALFTNEIDKLKKESSLLQLELEKIL